MKNIYVGNLSMSVTEETLRNLFESKGQVARVKIIQDKFTGQSRGFGFAEMPNDDEALEAINSLNGHMLEGRALKVNEALEKREGTGFGGSRPPQGGGYRNNDRSGGSRFGNSSGGGFGGSSSGSNGGWSNGPRQKRY